MTQGHSILQSIAKIYTGTI